MDAKPPKIPTPDKVFSPDPEPVGVEFLGAGLPEHVRAFSTNNVSRTTQSNCAVARHGSGTCAYCTSRGCARCTSRGCARFVNFFGSRSNQAD